MHYNDKLEVKVATSRHGTARQKKKHPTDFDVQSNHLSVQEMKTSTLNFLQPSLKLLGANVHQFIS